MLVLILEPVENKIKAWTSSVASDWIRGGLSEQGVDREIHLSIEVYILKAAKMKNLRYCRCVAKV